MKYKILIVEDDSVIRSEIRTLLLANGYEVYVVSDFSKTINNIKEETPNLILLDIKLPQKNLLMGMI